LIVAFAGGMGVAALRDAQSADAVGPGTTAAAAKRPPIAEGAVPGRAAARVTIAWGGDTVLGSDYGLPADRGMVLLEHVAPLLRSADVGWVNLEEALATGGSSKCVGATSGNCFAFGAPPSYASTLRRAGIRIVNLANNHADDYGASGRASTLAALRDAHVAWDGKPGEIEVLTVRGLRIAFLGFAPYPWASRLDDIPSAVALVRHAAAKADLVLVAIHAGAEGRDAVHVPVGTEYYLGENRGNSRAFAHAVISAGAIRRRLRPHVVCGAQWYHGRLILYSSALPAGARWPRRRAVAVGDRVVTSAVPPRRRRALVTARACRPELVADPTARASSA
jgi:hypothetical protein